MGHGRQFEQSAFASGGDGLHIALQYTRNEWIIFPFGMLRGKYLQAIQNERKLKIHRVLAPQSPVVIENRNPLFGFDELTAVSRGHSTNKIHDALLRGTFVPGRKRSLTGTYSLDGKIVGLMGAVIVVVAF